MSYIKVMRDFSGLPTEAEIRSEGRLYKVSFSQDKFTFNRQPNKQVLDMLHLVYPFNEKTVLTIPEPLSTVPVSGGKTLLYDDMEGLLKWEQGAATVALDNAFAFNGSQSLSVDGALGALAIATRYFAIQSMGKIKFSCKFAIETSANLTDLNFILDFYHSSVFAQATIQYTPATRTWELNNGTALIPVLVEPIGLYERQGVGGPWHEISVTVDLNTREYTFLRCDGLYWKGSVLLPHGASATPVNSRISLYVDAAAGVDCTVWFDDVLITEENGNVS